MDKNEIIALSIVVLAVLLTVRYFIKQKGGACCVSGCSPKFDKKKDISKPGEKK